MRRLVLFALVAAPLVARPLVAQDTSSVRQQGRGNRPARDPHRAGPASTWRGAVDTVRERELYVSKDPKDLRGCAPQICDRDLANKRRTDSIYAAKAPGNYEFQKIKYKSRADGLEMKRSGTEVMAVRHARVRDAEVARAADRFVHGQRTCWKREAAFRVDENGAALFPDDLRLRGPLGAAIR